MNKVALILVACLGLAGCEDSTYRNEPEYPSPPAYGCVVVADDMGEREVCDTYYYYDNGELVYYDAHFNIWVGNSGYWIGGRYHWGFYPAWHSYYGPSFYYPRGHFGYHGAFRGGERGGYRGGGFRGHGGRR